MKEGKGETKKREISVSHTYRVSPLDGPVQTYRTGPENALGAAEREMNRRRRSPSTRSPSPLRQTMRKKAWTIGKKDRFCSRPKSLLHSQLHATSKKQLLIIQEWSSQFGEGGGKKKQVQGGPYSSFSDSKATHLGRTKNTVLSTEQANTGSTSNRDVPQVSISSSAILYNKSYHNQSKQSVSHAVRSSAGALILHCSFAAAAAAKGLSLSLSLSLSL
jgi:hypothetical protein